MIDIYTANPTRVAIEELQLHDLKNIDAGVTTISASFQKTTVTQVLLTCGRCTEEGKPGKT
jgi:hypothetical protein